MTESNPGKGSEERQVLNSVVEEMPGKLTWKLGYENASIEYYSPVENGRPEHIGRVVPSYDGPLEEEPDITEVARFFAAVHRDLPNTDYHINVRSLFYKKLEEREQETKEARNIAMEIEGVTWYEGNPDF